MTFPRRSGEEEHTAGMGDRGDRTVVGVIAEMLMLPFTAMLYGMELLVRAMQGTQDATERSMTALVGGGALVNRGSDGGPEPRPAQPEAATMDTSIGYESRRDRDLRDDTLKLVRYKILFVKREYEVAFTEQEDLVYDNMDGTSFAAWKVAEFIQGMHRDGVRQPARWAERCYPAHARYFKSEGVLQALPEDDKKYLRVYYEVLDRYPREKFRHEEQQIRVLEQIRDRMGADPGCPPMGGAAAGGNGTSGAAGDPGGGAHGGSGGSGSPGSAGGSGGPGGSGGTWVVGS